MKKYLLFGLSLVLSLTIWAQERTVTGTVTDGETGESVPGATVVVKGTTNGTITDFNGAYSLTVGDDATLQISFVGYATQEVAVGSRSVVDVELQLDVQSLSEVVVVGYGSQDKKEITSAVVSLDEESFNKGNINDPSQLLQGKVPGLSVYNKGSDPNSSATIRLRGISTVGANTEPLVVVDGVIGATLDNVDPNDIESINVLKDGSAAAIYGSRGSSGVILVTTKRGKRGGGVNVDYNGFVAAATILNEQPVFTPQEYVGAGGNDLGGQTDWQDEVTRTGVSNVHNIAISGGNETTTFRLSTNLRDINGILDKSGFDQINARANINHFALNDKLQISFNMSLTSRESNFSFNEALRYAILYNPTAPVRFDNGEFYQAILFDNFNPKAILEQNTNVGKRKDLNFNTQLSYEIIDGLTANVNYGQQYGSDLNGEYYPRSSLFRGFNRGGLARRYTNNDKFTLFETYVTYDGSAGNLNFAVTGGYSFQQDEFEDIFIEMGDFPSDELGFNALELSGDRVSNVTPNISSGASPDSRIIAFFGRANVTFDNAIFFNASVRREGSTKLGVDNQWGIFPAFGVGVDLNRYLSIGGVDLLKIRAGYGITGSLPSETGLAQDLYEYSFQGGGEVSLSRDANPDLKWEQKKEINIGIDFALLDNRLVGAIDVYNRDIEDFILERSVSTDLYPSGTRFENVGALNTKGAELSLNYTSIQAGDFSWSPGIVLSTYKTILEDYLEGFEEGQMRANLGSPGQNATNMVRVATGEEIGQIWGPVFSGTIDDDGAPVMKDLNGDGQLITDQGSALADNGDFTQLGNGLPDLELGWTNQITFRNWDFNAFFRGAFGHSLVNTYRAFYEPIDPGAINSYNRISTDKAPAGLEVAQFSSLYVEKADFLKLDNATLGYNLNMSNSDMFRRVRVYLSVQNAFVLTNYEGIDPEPILQDFGPIGNGDFLDTSNPDVLAPGIDRRNNYFTARTFTFGINLGF